MNRQLVSHYNLSSEDELNNVMRNSLTLPLAFLASNIYMPITDLVDGHVVLFNDVSRNADDEDITRFRFSLMEDIENLDSFNHVYVIDNFLHIDYYSNDFFVEFCETIRKSWISWLNYCYPDRKFEVYINGELNETEIGFRELIK